MPKTDLTPAKRLQTSIWQLVQVWFVARAHSFGISLVCLCVLVVFPSPPPTTTADGWSAGKRYWTASRSQSVITLMTSICTPVTRSSAARGRSVPVTASRRWCNSTWPKAARRWRTAAAPRTPAAGRSSEPSSRACPKPAPWVAPKPGASVRGTSSAEAPWAIIYSTAGNSSAAPAARTRAAMSSRTCANFPKLNSWILASVMAQSGLSASSSNIVWKRFALTLPPWMKKAPVGWTMMSPIMRITQNQSSRGTQVLLLWHVLFWLWWHPFWLWCPVLDHFEVELMICSNGCSGIVHFVIFSPVLLFLYGMLFKHLFLKTI